MELPIFPLPISYLVNPLLLQILIQAMGASHLHTPTASQVHTLIYA